MMRYFLGVDGGGTKVEAILTDQNGQIVGAGRSGASNSYFVGKDAALTTVSNAVNSALDTVDRSDVAKVAICSAGMKKYRGELVESLGIAGDRVILQADELNVFISALGKEYGAVVLAGTGSFAMGINKKAVRVTIGGWGPVIGDPGSGRWMAVQALQAVAMEYDGIGPSTLLTEKIKGYYSIDNMDDLRRVVVMGNVNAVPFLVKEAVQAGDRVASTIINAAAGILASMANVIITRLDLDHSDYELALTGGISNFGEFILQPFMNAVRSVHQNIMIIKPRFAPVLGSVMIAAKEDNVKWSEETLSNLKESYEKVIW